MQLYLAELAKNLNTLHSFLLLLPSPKEAAADPLPKQQLFGWSSPEQLLLNP